MAMTIDLPPDVEQRLVQEAARLGLPPESVVVGLLSAHLPCEDRRARVAAQEPTRTLDSNSLRGKVIEYTDPSHPVAEDDWEAAR